MKDAKAVLDGSQRNSDGGASQLRQMIDDRMNWKMSILDVFR